MYEFNVPCLHLLPMAAFCHVALPRAPIHNRRVLDTPKYNVFTQKNSLTKKSDVQSKVLHVHSKELSVPSKEPHNSWKEPYKQSKVVRHTLKSPLVKLKRAFLSTKEHHLPSTDPNQH